MVWKEEKFVCLGLAAFNSQEREDIHNFYPIENTTRDVIFLRVHLQSSGMFTHVFRHDHSLLPKHSLLPNIFVAVAPIVVHQLLQEFLRLQAEWLVSLELEDSGFFWNDVRLKLKKGWRKREFVSRSWADTAWRGLTLRYFRLESNTVQ